MLTITLNGQEEKINIGCRTFVSLADLLAIIGFSGEQATVNGDVIKRHEYLQTVIKGGEVLIVS